MQLVHHRWFLEILRAVATGPKRNRDLLAELGTGRDPVHSNTLAATLRRLAGHQLIRVEVVRESPRVSVYHSTPMGLELLELLEALERFVAQYRRELGTGPPDDT
jgi:DNA-binding HxlR family transcriptional regulator